MVEEEERIARLRAHDVEQIMGGRTLDSRCRIGAERLVYKQAGRAGGRPGGGGSHGKGDSRRATGCPRLCVFMPSGPEPVAGRLSTTSAPFACLTRPGAALARSEKHTSTI